RGGERRNVQRGGDTRYIGTPSHQVTDLANARLRKPFHQRGVIRRYPIAAENEVSIRTSGVQVSRRLRERAMILLRVETPRQADQGGPLPDAEFRPYFPPRRRVRLILSQVEAVGNDLHLGRIIAHGDVQSASLLRTGDDAGRQTVRKTRAESAYHQRAAADG